MEIFGNQMKYIICKHFHKIVDEMNEYYDGNKLERRKFVNHQVFIWIGHLKLEYLSTVDGNRFYGFICI